MVDVSMLGSIKSWRQEITNLPRSWDSRFPNVPSNFIPSLYMLKYRHERLSLNTSNTRPAADILTPVRTQLPTKARPDDQNAKFCQYIACGTRLICSGSCWMQLMTTYLNIQVHLKKVGVHVTAALAFILLVVAVNTFRTRLAEPSAIQPCTSTSYYLWFSVLFASSSFLRLSLSVMMKRRPILTNPSASPIWLE